jgi:hypothetical protein
LQRRTDVALSNKHHEWRGYAATDGSMELALRASREGHWQGEKKKNTIVSGGYKIYMYVCKDDHLEWKGQDAIRAGDLLDLPKRTVGPELGTEYKIESYGSRRT